jgi:hypothetical protein
VTRREWLRSNCSGTRRNEPQAFLYAFDLLELNGDDLRREPIEVHPEGLTVFQHACKMGLEGIVSKRLGSRYRSGRSPDWLKFKNPEAPAVRREAEEELSEEKRRWLRPHLTNLGGYPAFISVNPAQKRELGWRRLRKAT